MPLNEQEARMIGSEFRRVYKRIDELERRLANMMLQGPIAEVKDDMVRLELGPPAKGSDKPFLSPWVQVQEAAGQTGTHFPVKKGDPMRLLSPNGELGSGSLAIRDGYTKDAKNPTDKKQRELVIAHNGPVRIKGSEITLEADGKVNAKAADLTHDDVSVGKTHRHTGVEKGPDKSGPPEQ